MPGPPMQHQDWLPDAGLRNMEGQRAPGNRNIDKAMRNPRQRRGTYVVCPDGRHRTHGTHPALSHTTVDMLRGFAAAGQRPGSWARMDGQPVALIPVPATAARTAGTPNNAQTRCSPRRRTAGWGLPRPGEPANGHTTREPRVPQLLRRAPSAS